MSIIGVTGHRELTAVIEAHVRAQIAAILREQPQPVLGMSSLADGADLVFAETVLWQGGTLHAVLPALGYQSTVQDAKTYERLLKAADEVTVLEFDEPGPQAYEAAGRLIVEKCDLLVAVWDGAAPRGPGGTAAAVNYAHSLGRPVRICWPDGAIRP
ncbi:hypothetical protein [Actinocrispum sp. NPDC049592]|uniref:hypothetical protein n=1 Tax=Actinocrispum sp. NPDC049592 TaxID=3154835 RepID=UPI003420D81D